MSHSKDIILDNKRTIKAWAMFDWANSAFALVITTAIFPIYFNSVVDKDFVLFGMEMSNSALFSYCISIAYIIIVLISPLLSGIADYGGRRLFFMKMFTLIGSIACVALFWFTGMHRLYLGISAFVLSVIGFAGGQVFYNSFLPLIVSEEKYDKVSAQGFAYGYIGSVLLLIFILVIIQFWEQIGLPSVGYATRTAFILVGVWWYGFAQIPFKRLPKDDKSKVNRSIIKKGYEEIKKVWNEVKYQVNTKRFLYAFFFYSAGAQTAIYLASTFASAELHIEKTGLILLILLLQLVGIVGAYFFSYLSKSIGNKISIQLMLLIWIGICVGGYFVATITQFYIIAAFVGLVMGGIQSLSRSTYTKLIPEDTEDTTSYFSFYDVLEKGAIVVGTFTFGIVNQVMGSMRNSLLSLAVFFVVGSLILLTVRMRSERGS